MYVFNYCVRVEEISQQVNKSTYQLINQTISLLSPTPAYWFTQLYMKAVLLNNYWGFS